VIRLYARHPVTDYAAWRKAYDDFDAERAGMGVTAHAVYQSVDDPNDITVCHEFASEEQAKAFASSPRLREVMEQAGVAGEPEIWFVSEA
jgi:quinol monooxygenase YgiN